MITIKEISYGSFGRCVQVSNGTVDFVATLDVGPRIIRFGFVGGENEFFEDTENNVAENNAAFKEKFDSDIGWRIYGGHRVWTAPQAEPRTYYPDNDLITYEEIPNGIRVISPAPKWTNTHTEMEITIAPDSSIDVIHKVTNTGAWSIEFAAWALSVMAPGGLSVVPLPKTDTGVAPNVQIALWPWAVMNDSRVYYGDKYITLRQDPSVERAYKIGVNCEHGWAAYFNHSNLFVKHFPTGGKNYPDGGVNYETYTNAHMIELESLGELESVVPGESITHTEKWRLFADVTPPVATDEEGISSVMSKILG